VVEPRADTERRGTGKNTTAGQPPSPWPIGSAIVSGAQRIDILFLIPSSADYRKVLSRGSVLVKPTSLGWTTRRSAQLDLQRALVYDR
jgi:hypothetical protein